MSSLQLLERKEYLVAITILEARGIQGKDAGSTSDPFVRVRVADQWQQTQKKYEVNSAIWNQTLTFTGVKMNMYELETFEMNIELYDHNDVFADEFIGTYSIGLSSLYRHTNHEYYKRWISLFNPTNGNVMASQAYMLITAFIVGPNEKPPVHAADEDFDPDAEDPASDEDEEDIAKKVEAIKKAQNLMPVGIPQMIDKKYQLSITIDQGYGLASCDDDGEKPNAFVSARVFGCVLTTQAVKNMKPKWYTKFQMPLMYPVMNDKITIRVWHRRRGLMPNMFIANVPEQPTATDSFNITVLQAQDGRMKATWINLYGTKPADRTSRTRGMKQGSQWLGRILISFNIVSTERPQLMTQVANPIKEPKQANYQLWVDLYELDCCDFLSEGDSCHIIASLGDKSTEPQCFKFSKKKNKWRFKQINVESLKELLQPVDVSQVPDIFLDLFVADVRVGYLRIKAADCLSAEPKPSWLRLNTPYNDTGTLSPGMLLCNVQYLAWDEDEETDGKYAVGEMRIKKESEGAVKYRFYYQIIQGFELATSIEEKKLCTRVEMRLGSAVPDTQKGVLCTKNVDGHYPVWNCVGTEMVNLDREINFESDLKIEVINKKSRDYYALSNKPIGTLLVPLDSITKQADKPQFFNIINYEGQFQGQILANFYLMPYVPNKKEMRSIKNYKENQPEHKKMIELLRQPSIIKHRVDITVSIFGIRNLRNDAKDPVIKVRLSHQMVPAKEGMISQTFRDNLKQKFKTDETPSPNFGFLATFKNVKLPRDPLYWPYLEILVTDKGRKDNFVNELFRQGCENCYTTISLLDFADRFYSDRLELQLRYCQEQQRRNQDALSLVQRQIDPQQFMVQRGIAFDPSKLVNGEDGFDTDMPTGTGGNLRDSRMPDGSVLPGLSRGSKDDAKKKGSVNLFREIVVHETQEAGGKAPVDELEQIYAVARKDKKGAEGGGKGEAKHEMEGDGEDSADEMMEQLLGAPAKQSGNNALETGILIDLEDVEEVAVTAAKKLREDAARDGVIEDIEGEIKVLQHRILEQKPEDPKYREKKDKLGVKVLELRESIEELKVEKMTEERFWGMLALDDAPTIDYGRDTLKEETMERWVERLRLMAYKRYPLFLEPDWYGSSSSTPIVQVSGILRSGIPSGATIKAAIKIRESTEEELEEKDEPQDQEEDGDGENTAGDEEPEVVKEDPVSLDESMPSEDEEEDDKKADDKQEQHEKVLKMTQKYIKQFPFTMFKQRFIDNMEKDSSTSYRVRLYLLTAQNLTPTGVFLDVKSQMAGMTALSAANPYPVVTINGKKTNKGENDRDRFQELELSPQIHRVYEFGDVVFPEEWKLEIEIHDRAFIPIADQLIGRTVIDLEDRLYSNPLYMLRRSLAIRVEKAKKTKKKAKKDKALKKEMDQLIRELTEVSREVKKLDQFYVPVEFRELWHPSKEQPQGILECWVEVLTSDDGAKVPIAKMQSRKSQTFEIRLIVWETRYVPLVDGDKVDIWISVIYDPTGRPEDEIKKRTDTHMGSKTGWGQFNWRMKFDLELPCDAPRFRIGIHDADVFSDEIIGESQITLKKTVHKLDKEPNLEVPKTYISFTHPNHPGEDRGIMMFSMTILPKDEADEDPVGEAQEEPNQNPRLKRPSAGRGFMDAIGGISFDFELNLSFNPFGPYIYVIMAIAVLGMLISAGLMLK